MKRLAWLALVASAVALYAQSPPPQPTPSATPVAGVAPQMLDNEALRRIVYAVTHGGALPVGSNTQLTPTLVAATTNGSVAAGSRSATFVLSTDFTGSILGQSITGTAPGGALTFNAGGEHTNSAIAYTISAGTAWILTER